MMRDRGLSREGLRALPNIKLLDVFGSYNLFIVFVFIHLYEDVNCRQDIVTYLIRQNGVNTINCTDHFIYRRVFSDTF